MKDLKWWDTIREGHYVRCKSKSGASRGAGYQPDMEFKIIRINRENGADNPIFFPEKGHGVYADSCEPSFKEGDWVTKITPWGSVCDGRVTYKVAQVRPSGAIAVDWPACPLANDYSSTFRHATKEEIAQYDNAGQTFDDSRWYKICDNGTNKVYAEHYVKGKISGTAYDSFKENITSGDWSSEIRNYGLAGTYRYEPVIFDVVLPFLRDRNKELLAEALKQYPKGTEYKNAASKRIQAVKGVLNFHAIGKSGLITDGCGGSVYLDGVWADYADSRPFGEPVCDRGLKVTSVKDSKPAYPKINRTKIRPDAVRTRRLRIPNKLQTIKIK
jgi:hypothetical protein